MPRSIAASISDLTEKVEELIAKNDAGKAQDSFLMGYADDPVGFIRDVLQSDPWPKQQEIAEAVRDNAQVTVRSANSIGKDWLAARMALWWIYAVRGFVLITAPTQRQVKEVLMRKEIAGAWRAGVQAHGLNGRLFTDSLRFPNDEKRGILAFTSTDPSKLTGFHAAKTMVIITEAQSVEDFVWEALFACAVADDDRFLVVGNPVLSEGMFYDTHTTLADWTRFAISAYDHPNVQTGETLIPGATTRTMVKRIKSTYGEDSPQYKIRILGNFASESEFGMFSRQKIEEAVKPVDPKADYGPGMGSLSGGYLSFGVDVSRSVNGDQCAIAVMKGDILLDIHTREAQGDLMDVTGWIVNTLRRYKLKPRGEGGDGGFKVNVDETGLGAGVLDRLIELGWPAVGVHFGANPSRSEKHRFVNRRASLYGRARDLLERGDVTLNANMGELPALVQELLAIQYRIESTGKMRLEPKTETKKRLKRSPDRADAWVTALDSMSATMTIGATARVVH